MSLLSSIVIGKKIKPMNILIHARHGLGKSTLASEFPKPIFLGAEENDELEAARFPKVETWEQLINQVDSLYNDKHDFKTAVVDTIDGLEQVAAKKILSGPNAGKTLATACGGYGKGYEELALLFVGLRDKLAKLRDDRGMNIVILAHSEKVKFEDPITMTSYDSYTTAIHKKVKSTFQDWVSAILFLSPELMKVTDSSGKDHALSDGERILYSEERPSHVAKNRFGMEPEFTYEIGKGYAKIAEQVKKFYSDVKKPVKKVAKKVETVKTELPKKETETIKTETVDAFETMATYKDLMMESDELFVKMPENIKPKISIAIRAAGTNVDELERIIIKMRGIAK